jgi:hypothetical protein
MISQEKHAHLKIVLWQSVVNTPNPTKGRDGGVFIYCLFGASTQVSSVNEANYF